MKATIISLILFSFLFFSLSCAPADEEKGTYPRNSSLQSEFNRAAIFWNSRGHDLQPSDNPEITAIFSTSLSPGEVARHIGPTIYYGSYFLQQGPEARKKIIAHEIGHILGYFHVIGCGNIMSRSVGCLKWSF